MSPLYFIDEGVLSDIFFQNSVAIFKLLIVAYFLFYYFPKKLFPQPKTTFQMEIIIVNIIYMVTFIEIFVTLLIFLKIFSIPMFLILLFITKLFVIKFYDKKDPFEILDEKRVTFMIFVLDILDEPKIFYQKLVKKLKLKLIDIQREINFYNIVKVLLYVGVIIYIFVETMSRGLESLSYSIADTAQFVDWVNHLQKNVLYSDQQVGADFYGIAILIFFINTFSNIDVIILFSIYPVLLFLALYFAIFYVIRDFTHSNFVAIFGVMVHGLFLMSPLASYVLSEIIKTDNPMIAHFMGLSYYLPTEEQLKIVMNLHSQVFEFEAYQRYLSGMAYEHSSIFVLLNAYFLIKSFELKTNKYIVLYTLTLFLVFTFHGGGAIPLIIISILITINSVLFLKLDFRIIKKGLFGIFVSAILGNLWILSMLKYGIPKDFGAAAPFLDKWLHTKQYSQALNELGIFDVAFIVINNFHYFLLILFIVNLIIILFRKNRFVNISFLLIIFGVFILYFGPMFGFPNLVNFLRLSEYFFFAVTLLLSISFYYIYKLLPKILISILLYILLIFAVLAFPRWTNTEKEKFLINKTEWTSIPKFIVNINKYNVKFTWTFISYVQDYSKVKDKGYHIDVAKFLLKYSPLDKYLRIPTEKVFIAVEDFTHPYKGMDEWYYRWRGRVENNLKAWVATYQIHHNNIKVAYRSKLVTVYEIDNKDYLYYLANKNRKGIK